MNVNPLFSAFHNRVAVDGDKLVTHRFKNRNISMVTRDGFESWLRESGCGAPPAVRNQHRTWPSIKGFLAGCATDFLAFFGVVDLPALSFRNEPGPIVEIPSEALLRICDIPPNWQSQYHFRQSEEALFYGHSALSGAPYGSLYFGNGVTVPMQALNEAQNVTVIGHSWPETLEAHAEPIRSAA